MDIMLAPDVYVNASLSPTSAPAQVVQRVLGQHKGETIASDWVLSRIAAILTAVPEFKREAVEPQVDLIRSYVKVVQDAGTFGPEAWEEALVGIAKNNGVKRVVTDHPDLLAREMSNGVEFVSTEAWLLEVTTPPPVPPPRA